VEYVRLAVAVIPAAAITYGEPDGNSHPQVGLLVFDVNGVPAWRCSGTLISPTVMLTAGHCTFGTSGGRVWFDADVSAGRPGNGYPFAGGTGIEFSAINTHPNYNDNAFYLHDAGVVILSEPVYGVSYGSLSAVGVLDELATSRGLQNQLFTPVGYGIQSIKPEFMSTLVRYRATMMLVDVNGTVGIPRGGSVVFSNNAGKAATGGTCFGDSGGPIFIEGTTTIVAVTSFGLNSNCKGTTGGYRVDTADDQAFINQFLP
jgi:hypothetical protein